MPAKARLAILISGSGTNMAALLYASRAPTCPYEVVLVASNDPDAGGLKLAAAEGVPTFALSHKGMDRESHDAAMDKAIRQSGADHVALAGYMRILTPGFVRSWEGRMFNIHPSLLPKYRGLHTHARAIESGDGEHGASVHFVIPELDAGAVIAQAVVPVNAGDTPELLAERVLGVEHPLLLAVMRLAVSGRLAEHGATVQVDGHPLFTPLRLDFAGRLSDPASGVAA